MIVDLDSALVLKLAKIECGKYPVRFESSVRKIFNSEGTLITDPQKVRQEIEKFYSNLCKKDTIGASENTLNSFLTHTDMPKLSQAEVSYL